MLICPIHIGKPLKVVFNKVCSGSSLVLLCCQLPTIQSAMKQPHSASRTYDTYSDNPHPQTFVIPQQTKKFPIPPLRQPTSLFTKPHLLVSTTYRPTTFPSFIRSYAFCNSLSPIILIETLISPRRKKSMASALSLRFPTYDPLMVMHRTTVWNTDALR